MGNRCDMMLAFAASPHLPATSAIVFSVLNTPSNPSELTAAANVAFAAPANASKAGSEALEVDVRQAPDLRGNIDGGWISSHLRRAANLLSQRDGVQVARLSVLIVDDARMQHLHERHSGEKTTTDVLTFDLRADKVRPVEADLVVCADEAARRAVQLGHSIERELLLYCIHGLLHCLGHDDHDEAGWRAMHAREDEILAAIGVGATFHSDRSNPGVKEVTP